MCYCALRLLIKQKKNTAANKKKTRRKISFTKTSINATYFNNTNGDTLLFNPLCWPG